MATGTGAGLLDGPQPQSVFKHGILDQHAIRYATMTASRLPNRRAVLVDGFAGRGRFDTGQAASAELMMLHAQKMKASTRIDIFLIEKKRKDFLVLDSVADEYRARGINIETRHGECVDYLEEAVVWAKDASLFLFLDPCGAMLPFDLVHKVVKERGNWPRTEVLMNFNADLIRRGGGQYAKGQLDLGGVASADRVCGGDWWRDIAVEAHIASGRKDWEASAEAVALEYARRLARGTDKGFVVAPVRRQPHHQPVYFLVFLTADPHGHWVFGHAASVAREKWLHAIGPDEDEQSGMLFELNTIDDQIAAEKLRAERIIEANLRELVADGQPKSVVKHTIAIFGDAYGEARETTFSAVLRKMIKAGEIQYVEKGAKPYKHVIQKVS
jgi:three-Cys-motif partner protein